MPPRAAMIALLIIERPLCLACIASRANTTEVAVQGYLAVMRQTLTVYHEDTARCRACGTIGKVYSLTRPAL